MNKSLHRRLFILLSVIIALMLMILPLPTWAHALRPLWAPLVIFYWALALPDRVNVGVAWSVGMVMDVLLGLPLGEQALLLTLVTFILVKFHQRIRLFPLWQQSGVIFVLLLLYFAVQYWLQIMLREPPASWVFWLPTITTAVLWPWVFIVLRDYRRRTGIK